MIETSSYSVFLAWSEADEAYIANVFELPGCMAHGETRGEAIAQIEIAIVNWLETAKELGREIPPPRHLESYEQEVEATTEATRRELEAAWKQAFEARLEELQAALKQAMKDAQEQAMKDVVENVPERLPRGWAWIERRPWHSNVTEKK